MSEWVPPNVYPYVDTDPRARCHWWGHGKAFVRTINSQEIERYDCRCGNFYWLSQPKGHRPIVRHRPKRHG